MVFFNFPSALFHVTLFEEIIRTCRLQIGMSLSNRQRHLFFLLSLAMNEWHT